MYYCFGKCFDHPPKESEVQVEKVEKVEKAESEEEQSAERVDSSMVTVDLYG